MTVAGPAVPKRAQSWAIACLAGHHVVAGIVQVAIGHCDWVHHPFLTGVDALHH